MHSKGIMHRDLKLSNILLCEKNDKLTLKIADLGLATKVEVDKYIFHRCGTPGYIAPEIITSKKDQKYTEKCDIFSIGIIFYILYVHLIIFLS